MLVWSGIDINEDFVAMGSPLPGIEVRCADMEDFDLGRTFDRILLPSSVVYCLDDLESVITCFESVRRHLSEGGEVIFDAYNVDDMVLEDWSWGEGQTTDRGDYVATLNNHGVVSSRTEGTEDVFELSKHVAQDQKIFVRYTHVLRDQSPQTHASDSPSTCLFSYELEHQYLLSYQIFDIFGAAGLEVTSIAGGFCGEEFDPDSPYMIVTGKAKV